MDEKKYRPKLDLEMKREIEKLGVQLGLATTDADVILKKLIHEFYIYRTRYGKLK